MAKLKAEIYGLLETDAKLSGSDNLGHTSRLNQSSTKPYGIHFRNPPDDIDFETVSVLTYFISSLTGEKPVDMFLTLTAWGSKYEAILERVYDLLHRRQADISPSDYVCLLILRDFVGPESFDEARRQYYRQDRYRLRIWKS